MSARTRRLPSLRTGGSAGLKADWEKELLAASTGDTPPPSLRDVRHCVILSRGDDVSSAFLASLERHGIHTVVIGHPLLAFAHLLRFEQGRRSSGGWGLPDFVETAMIVADRDRWDRLDRLLDAVRTQLPHVAVWVSAANLLLEVRDVPHPDDLPAFPETPQLRLTSDPSIEDLSAPDGQTESTAWTEPTPNTAPNPMPNPMPGPMPDAAGPDEADVARPAPTEPDRPSARSGAMSAAVTPEEIEMLLRLFPASTPDTPTPPGPGGGA